MRNNPVEDYLGFILDGLVNYPEDIKIIKTLDEKGVLITIEVNESDMPIIIGSKAATIKAIRQLARVFGRKHSAHVCIKLNEPEGGRFKEAYQGD